jgi:drug/metabolite transporter (DMT)-like permease
VGVTSAEPSSAETHSAEPTTRGPTPAGSLLAGSLLVVTAAVFFGTLGPVSRLGYDAGLTPLGFVAWRSLIGAVVLGAGLLVLRRRGTRLVDLRRVPRRQAALLISAGVASALLNVAIFIAFERLSIALALLAFYTYPAMIGVITTVSGHERLDWTRLVALVLALGGMTLVVLGQLGAGGTEAHLDALGLGLALLAAGCNVLYVLSARGGFPAVPVREATFVILVVNEVCFAVIAVVGGGLGQVFGPLGLPASWTWLLWAGILGAAIPTVLFTAGLRRIGAVRTSILMLLEPVVGAAIAALVLREPIVAIQVAGGALVLTGAALAQRRSTVAEGGVGPAVAETVAEGEAA